MSIKCWVCRSDSDPKCADPFDNSTVPITDCKQEPDLEHLPGVRPTMCRKIRQKGIIETYLLIFLCLLAELPAVAYARNETDVYFRDSVGEKGRIESDGMY